MQLGECARLAGAMLSSVSAKSSGPIAAEPLKTLKELADTTSVNYVFTRGSVPLAPSGQPDRPRLLVCHDFKGGYQDDKWVQGNHNGGAYSLWHWDLIDVFVYFAHDLVTLPPPGWINAAHKHGVRVLGTFITEWKEGKITCAELLASHASVRLYASRLAELACSLGFDGWLINIENPIEQDQIPLLVEFVHQLTGMTRSLVPDSLVIWYDAVTIDGRLDWQNCLNLRNKAFFDVCDGIFTNYAWTHDNPLTSAELAGDRADDVYMGVDVFGRNTFGGGGFNSDYALKVARGSGVSAALFAPGWVYETDQGPDFHTAQDRWWDTIHAVWPPARRNPVTLPFFSDFDQGIGYAVYDQGRQISKSPWSNLSCQNLQVLFDGSVDGSRQPLKTFVSQEDKAYSGGSCVSISGSMPAKDVYLVNFYRSNLEISAGSLHVSYSVKLKLHCQLSLALKLEGDKGAITTIFLIEEDAPTAWLAKIAHAYSVKAPDNFFRTGAEEGNLWNVRDYHLDLEAGTITHIYALVHGENSYDKALRQKFQDLLIDPPPEPSLSSTCNPGSWVATADEDDPSSTLGHDLTYGALLGHIRIANWELAECKLRAVSYDFEAQHDVWSRAKQLLSILLLWRPAGSKDTQGSCQPEHFKIFTWEEEDEENPSEDGAGKAQFLGVAKVNAFYVYHLPLRPRASKLRFAMKPVCVCGGSEDLPSCPQIRVTVP